MTILSLFLIFSMLAVLCYDSTRYIIPNWLVLAVMLAYAYAVFSSPFEVDWRMAVAGAGLTLVLGYAIFMLRMMGAGDVKLLSALALWTGVQNLPDFLFITTLLGGALSLVLWLGRKALPHLPKKPKKENLPRILQEGAPVPYGIGIALAFLIMLWMGKIPVLAG